MHADEQDDFAPHGGPNREPGGELGPGLGGLIDEAKRLAADGRTFAEAELAFQLTRAKVLAVAAGWMAAFGLGALIFVHFALIALVVGLVFALATVVGAWWAMLIVTGALAALALASLLLLRARWRRVSTLVFGTGPAKPKDRA